VIHLDDDTLLDLALQTGPTLAADLSRRTDPAQLADLSRRTDPAQLADLSRRTDHPHLADLPLQTVHTHPPDLPLQTDHPHLAACPRCRAALATTLDALHLLADDLPRVDPPASLRVRLLAAVAGPVARHSARVAELLRLPHADIAAALADVDRGTAPWKPVLPGIDVYSLGAGPRERGLIRATAGAFPYHRHLGDEHVLVLQGACCDSSGRHLGPGDEIHHTTGTAHHLEIHPGPALVFAYVSDGSDFAALPA